MTAPPVTTVTSITSLSTSSVAESNAVAQPAKRRKVFEVETVNESVNEADSPSSDHSELSAHSSTENLSIGAEASSQAHSVTTTESDGLRNVVLVGYSVNPLESKSDSYLSVRQQQEQQHQHRGMGSNISIGESQSLVAAIPLNLYRPPSPPMLCLWFTMLLSPKL